MRSAASTRRGDALPALTGLRFIAAAAVFSFHYGSAFLERSHAPAVVVQLSRNGYLGVSLFFMLSGFILTHSYAHRPPTRAADLFDYAVARVARLYPVYLLALLAALPMAWRGLSAESVVRVLTMTQSWTLPASNGGFAWIMQAWTLSVELLFYLAFVPLLPPLLRLTAVPIGLLAAAMAVVVVLLAAPTCTPGERITGVVAALPIPLVRLPEFIYGMCLARLVALGGQRIERGWTMAAIVALAGCSVVILAGTGAAVAVSLAMVLVGATLALLALPSGAIGAGLGARPAVLLGGASYALYLFQQPVRDWLRVFPGTPWDKPLNPVLALAVAICVFLWWEQPMRARIRRFLDGARPRRAVTVRVA